MTMGEVIFFLITIYKEKTQSILLNLRYRRRDSREKKSADRNHIPQLSNKDKKEINMYWKKYGVKFRDFSWFRKYYYVTGKKDPRFLPHPFLELIAYPYYNDLSKALVWADKNVFSRHLPCMKFPELIAQRVNFKIYDVDHHYYGKTISESVEEAIYKRVEERCLDSIIIKQTINTNAGRGVRKYHIASIEDVRAALAENDIQNFIIQEPIQQHDFFAQFNKNSVNIIRFNTWRKGENVIIFSPCIRFGMSNSITDVSYVDGKEIIMAAGISPKGIVGDFYCTNLLEKKPLLLENRVVPYWEEMCRLV